MKRKLEFLLGGGGGGGGWGAQQKPSVGRVCIFSGTAQFLMVVDNNVL